MKCVSFSDAIASPTTCQSVSGSVIVSDFGDSYHIYYRACELVHLHTQDSTHTSGKIHFASLFHLIPSKLANLVSLKACTEFRFRGRLFWDCWPGSRLDSWRRVQGPPPWISPNCPAAALVLAPGLVPTALLLTIKLELLHRSAGEPTRTTTKEKKCGRRCGRRCPPTTDDAAHRLSPLRPPIRAETRVGGKMIQMCCIDSETHLGQQRLRQNQNEQIRIRPWANWTQLLASAATN